MMSQRSGGKISKNTSIISLILLFIFIFIQNGNCTKSEVKGGGLTAEEKEALIQSTKIVVAIISWAEGVEARTEESLWRISTHPSVEGLMKLDLSSLHRARNTVIQSILDEAEKLAETNSITLTHILLVHQNVVFRIEDLEALIFAQKDIVGGLSLTKLPPYYPSFIPLKRDVNFCTTTPSSYFAAHPYHPSDDVSNSLIEVEAMSHPFSLFKLSALKKAKRIFNERGEWFYTSLGDDFFGSVNCYPPITCPAHNNGEGMTSAGEEWRKMMWEQMEEEDFCFARQMRKFGFKLHLLSSLHLPLSFPSLLSYSPPLQTNDGITNEKKEGMEKEGIVREGMEREGMVRIEFERGEGVVVENKLKEQRKGRKYTHATYPPQTARVVIATPIWRTMNTETMHRLYVLSQDINVIGRVGVHHESVITARNKLLRAIEEEFRGEDQYTHVLFVDADMTFQMQDLETLLYLDKDISMGLAVRRGRHSNAPAYLPLSSNSSDHSLLLNALSMERDKAIPIKAGGMAFTLIKRSVIQSLRSPGLTGDEWYWTEHWVDADTGEEYHFSEDYTFCRRAREMGYEIFLDSSVQLGHVDRSPVSIKHWLAQIGVSFSPISDSSSLPPPNQPNQPNQPKQPNKANQSNQPNQASPPNQANQANQHANQQANQPKYLQNIMKNKEGLKEKEQSKGDAGRPFRPPPPLSSPPSSPPSPSAAPSNKVEEEVREQKQRMSEANNELPRFAPIGGFAPPPPPSPSSSSAPKIVYSPLHPQII